MPRFSRILCVLELIVIVGCGSVSSSPVPGRDLSSPHPEISAQASPPGPEHAWEGARDLFAKLGKALADGDLREVRLFKGRIANELPASYAALLNKISRDFSHFVPDGPPETDLELAQAQEAKAYFPEVVLTLGAYPEAERLLREGIEERAKAWQKYGEAPRPDVKYRTKLAWALVFQGMFDEALETLDSLKQWKMDAWQQKRIPSIRTLVVGLRDQPGDAQFLADLSKALFLHGRWKFTLPFLAHVKSALSRDPGEPARSELFILSAEALRRIKDEAGAIAWEEKIFALPDKDTDQAAGVLLEQGNRAFKAKDYPVADRAYRRMLREFPESHHVGKALFNLGYVLQAQKRYGEARTILTRLLEARVNDRDPTGNIMAPYRNYRHRAILLIGAGYEAEGQWEKALQAYRDSRTRYPLHSFCGTCGRSAEERIQVSINRCLDLFPGKPPLKDR